MTLEDRIARLDELTTSEDLVALARDVCVSWQQSETDGDTYLRVALALRRRYAALFPGEENPIQEPNWRRAETPTGASGPNLGGDQHHQGDGRLYRPLGWDPTTR